MKNPHRLPELLAPAGSPEALRAAIAAGADAVYLSGKRFGARKYAANFSDTEIADAIRFAHSRGVRVYVTVNTLVHDRELRGVAEYLVWLYEAGADAVLVQDAGVAALAREIVPGLALHASTQMTIHNTAGVLWAAEQGFSRVVLARELALAEVRAIAETTRHTGTGLEVFAHGALCYSYSGQCLLSSVIGGRSGNRGMCAQPCRKPYTLVTGTMDAYGRPAETRDVNLPGRYHLSPKDLSTYRNLRELAEAPVVSLKIEGRMKSPEYVAIVVSTYRKALDAIVAGDWKPDPAVERDLLLAFNREFTKGYLFSDRHGALMSRTAPDNRGICIGSVTAQDRKTGSVTVSLRGTIVPETGDGLYFSGPQGKEEEGWGFQLNNAPVAKDKKTITFAIPRPAAPGSLVSVTSSRGLDAKARQIMARSLPEADRRIPVDLRIAIGTDGRVSMEGRLASASGKEIAITYRPDFAFVPARSHPLTAGQLEAQLRKTGDTAFAIRTCSLAYDGTLFAPVGEINRMRREFLARAEEALAAASVPPDGEIRGARDRLAAAFAEPARAGGEGNENPAPVIVVWTGTQDAVSAALQEGCTTICFEPSARLPRHTCGEGTGDLPPFREQAGAAMAACREAGAQFILKLPRITRDEELAILLPEIALLGKEGLSGCMADTTGAARAVRTLLPGMALSGGTGLNIFNHRSACRLSPPFRSLTLSPELAGDEYRDLIAAACRRGCTVPFALVVQGISDAMITEDCLREQVQRCRATGTGGAGTFLGIRDETGHLFPARTDGACRTWIGNAVETCLIDHLPAIRKAGVDEIVIDARGRTGAYAGAMVRIYREALGAIAEGRFTKETARALREQAKARSYGGITAGHFLRGLKD